MADPSDIVLPQTFDCHNSKVHTIKISIYFLLIILLKKYQVKEISHCLGGFYCADVAKHTLLCRIMMVRNREFQTFQQRMLELVIGI